MMIFLKLFFKCIEVILLLEELHIQYIEGQKVICKQR